MRLRPRRPSAVASAPATSTTRVPARAISPASMLRRPNSPRLSSPRRAPQTTADPVPAQIIKVGSTTPSCYVTSDQGFPTGLVTTFNPATDNITWVPKDRPDSYVENYFLSVQRQLTKNTLLDVAYVGNHGLHLEGFINANQRVLSHPRHRQRPETVMPTGPAILPRRSTSSIPTTMLFRFATNSAPWRGLTLLNSFTWEHSLDNASASLEGNTPSPQNGSTPRRTMRSRITTCRVANVTSLVYDLPFGHGPRFLSNANGVLDSVIGGWQISAINTAQAGTPFNLTYSPNCEPAGLAADLGNLPRRQRIPAGYRAGQEDHAGNV